MSLREQSVTNDGSLAELKAALALATRERNEALEQQAASAAVLKAISGAAFDLQAVLDTLLETACRLCEADIGTIRYEEGAGYRLAATFGCQPEWREHFARYSSKPDRSSVFGQTILKGSAVHIPDVLEDTDYARPVAQKLMGLRAALGVPLMRDGRVFGVVNLFRTSPRPFTQRQIDLLETFAVQATIAIENARLFEAEEQRSAELAEALERQTATSEVLQVISSSPGELAPVFTAMLENATRICQAKFGTLYLYEDGAFRAAAMHNVPPAFLEARRRQPVVKPSPDNPMALVAATKRSVQSADVPESTAWPRHEPNFAQFAKLTGARSLICVPMLKDDALVGVITVYREEVRPFTEKQTELLTNFAAQAVIAIENTRLLNELRQRTDDLTESLEQQTATSEVLQVISSSPGDLDPVFQAMLENAVRLCDAKFGNLFLYQDGAFGAVAMHNAPPAYAAQRIHKPLRPGPDTALARVARTKQPAQIEDMKAEPAYAARDPVMVAGVELAGIRTMLAVPMLKENELVGSINIYRQEVRPFNQKQIEIVSNFAAQAAIAIENTRLLNELRRRTDDLTESLQQQTATSEILEVISNSPTDSQPAFDAIVRSGLKLFPDAVVAISLPEGDQVKLAAIDLPDSKDREALIVNARARYPMPLSREYITGTAILEGREMDFADASEAPAYLMPGRDNFLASGQRAITVMPMMRGDTAIGAISVIHRQPRQLSEKQRALLRTFASQAVIAIENTRLFNELRQRTDDLTESLEQQTATSEVLKVISSSPGELEPVFQSMLENATRICEAKFGNLMLWEGDGFRAVALHGEAAFTRRRREQPKVSIVGWPALPLSRLVESNSVIQVADFRTESPYLEGHAPTVELVEVGGARTVVAVPMLKENELLGAIVLYRQEVRPFTDKQIELVTNFAAQAVIAIENTRLFNELRERTDDLTESLEQQTASGEILASISGSMADTKPVFGAIVRNLRRLFGTRFSMVQLLEDGIVHLAATGQEDEYGLMSKYYPRPLDDAQAPDKAMIARQVMQFVPVIGNPECPRRMQDLARQLGFNATIFAPMLRDGKVIGVIAVARDEAKTFTEKQVELIKTFAAQAVIAIENTRLFNELRQRTDDLAVALEQQTATADVLSVMSRSKFDLMPILQSVVDTAMKLCRADQAVIFRLDGDVYRYAAGYSLVPEYLEIERANPIAPGPGTAVGRAAMSRAVVRIEDAMSDAGYAMKEQAAVAHVHSIIGVPLLRDGEPIGVLALARCRVEPFSDREVDLVTTFADQAVIAIENVRLFEEVQKRTEDLAESLQQQTATADVLKVISRSTFDLQTVLDALTASAARLCGADKGVIFLRDGDALRLRANYGFLREAEEYALNHPLQLDRGSMTGRVALEGRAIHIPDVLADPEYHATGYQQAFGYRTNLGVPLLREGTTIGVFALTRDEVNPFTEKQIELVNTFADQAVIAIENVRLFDEIQDKSRQLEEASKHKSQFLANMSHELRTPLNAILGYTELIVDGVYGETPEKVQTALKRITTNGKHLLGLINDVLDLSKIEAGQLTLSLTDYSMKDVVHAVYGAVEPLAAEKKLAFKAEIAPDMPAGHGDERRLTQVLLNLVGNAIKFTDEGEVKIKAAASDGHFLVAVVDTGPGISEDDQKKLFQEFQQADSSTTKKKGGTGLGLAISKKIVEMHGGSVRLESSVGQGSTFSFTVPLRAEQAKKQA